MFSLLSKFRGVRRSWFYKYARTIYTQDVLFGLSNEDNMKEMIQHRFAAGPSMLIPAAISGMEIPFHAHGFNVPMNESTVRLFDLMKKEEFVYYYEFPEGVLASVQERNGLLVMSLINGKKQWDPEPLIQFVKDKEIEDLKKLPVLPLYQAYLKKQKLTVDQLNKIAVSQGVPEERSLSAYLKKYQVDVQEADNSLPSFTDVEFGYLLFCCSQKQLSNVAVMLPGEHLVSAVDIQNRLQELLALAKADDADYPTKVAEFLQVTKGSTASKPGYIRVLEAFTEIPLFSEILNGCDEFLKTNFEMLCLKLEAYHLNAVGPGEGLLVNLQFPMVYGGVPHFMTLLLCKDPETGSYQIEEVLRAQEDPLSIMSQSPSEELLNSALITGTPAASICVIQDPGKLKARAQELLTKISEADGEDSPLPAISQFLNLFSLFGGRDGDLKYLNGNPLIFSSRDDDWISNLVAMRNADFLHIKYYPKGECLEELFGEDPYYNYDEYGDIFRYHWDDQKEAMDPNNYYWYTPMEGELGPDFKVDRDLNKLPRHFPMPQIYAQHLGAAVPPDSKKRDKSEELE